MKAKKPHKRRLRVIGHGVLLLTERGPRLCVHPRHERCEISGLTGKELERRADAPEVLYEAKGRAHSGAVSAAYRRNWDHTFKN